MAANVTVLHLNYNKSRTNRDRHVELTWMPKLADIKKAFADGMYDKVAVVSTIDLDRAFELTNHIDHDWTENDGVAAEPGGMRSTSVGDILVSTDSEGIKRAFAVASFGFDELAIESLVIPPQKPNDASKV
jgi:hypothetical protein